MEISKLLLDACVASPLVSISVPINHCSASDDLEQPDKLRSLLKNLREARQAKSREGLKQLDHSELSVRSPLFSSSIPMIDRLCDVLIVAQPKRNGN